MIGHHVEKSKFDDTLPTISFDVLHLNTLRDIGTCCIRRLFGRMVAISDLPIDSIARLDFLRRLPYYDILFSTCKSVSLLRS